MKCDTAGFFEKWLDHPISSKTCIFEEFFEIFSETTLTILVLKRQNVEENDTEQTQKTGHQNLYPFSRYLSSKFFIDGPKSSFSAISWPILAHFLSVDLKNVRIFIQGLPCTYNKSISSLRNYKSCPRYTILHFSGGHSLKK